MPKKFHKEAHNLRFNSWEVILILINSSRGGGMQKRQNMLGTQSKEKEIKKYGNQNS